MKRVTILILVLIVLISLSSLWVFFQRPQKEIKEAEPKTEPLIEEEIMKEKNKIVMIVAFKDFKDEEYFVPRQIFEQADYEVITASYSRGTALGVDGGEIEVDILVDDLNPSDYQAVIFVGGPGAFNYFDDSRAHRVVQATIEADKVLGAICIAPAILAKAGVLAGRQATVWSSALDKSAVKFLTDNGAKFIEQNVVEDNKIITANGPEAAQEFAQTIIDAIK